MKIKLFIQITRDGFIARNDGMRDWYLNPATFGVSTFFDNAAVILDYDGEYLTQDKSGTVTVDSTLEELLTRLEPLTGYAAMDVAPHLVGFVQALIAKHCVEEIHVIQIGVELKEGIAFPLSDIQSGWKQVSVHQPVDDDRILYYIYKENV